MKGVRDRRAPRVLSVRAPFGVRFRGPGSSSPLRFDSSRCRVAGRHVGPVIRHQERTHDVSKERLP